MLAFTLSAALFVVLVGSADGVVRRRIGGDVHVGIPGPVAPADPIRVTTVGEAVYAAAVFDTLYQETASGLLPLLAATLPVPPGMPAATTGGTSIGPAGSKTGTATRWRIPLRVGATFHDGHPVTAATVIASLDRLAADAHGPSWLLAAIKGATARSASKKDSVSGLRVDGKGGFEIHTVYPVSAEDLARLFAAPATAITREPGRRGDPLVGSGPFVPAHATSGVLRLSLVANTRHVRGRPFVDRVVMRSFPSAKATRSAFTIGDLHLSLAGGRAYGTSEDTPDAATSPVVADLLRFGRVRTGRRILGKSELRAAVDHALDRDALTRFTLGAGAVAAVGLVPPALPFGRTGAPTKVNTSEARRLALLASRAAGEPMPTLRILFSTARPHHRDVGEKLVVSLRAAGMDAEVDPEPHVAYLRRLEIGDFDLALDELWLPAGGRLGLGATLAAAGRTVEAIKVSTRLGRIDLKTFLRYEKAVLANRHILLMAFRPARAWARGGLQGIGFGATGHLRLEDAFYTAGRPEKR